MTVELHQFLYSHYNEKVRWALAWKQVAHVRRSYLPGPHMVAIRRLSGQRQTPVLVWDGEVIAGSGPILDALEARVPTPPLVPEDAALRDQVMASCRYFDEEVGPAVRTALFSVLVEHGAYLCSMFAADKGVAKRLAYRATFPLARGMIARANGVTDPAGVEQAFAIVEQALERVATAAAATGQLVGDGFTRADLTAAALLAPLVNPDHPDMARPTPMPAPLVAFLDRWQRFDGARWVLEQYRRFRPAAPVEGL